MTTVYFARHAEPDFNNHDDLTRALTEKGKRDLDLVNTYLEDKHIEVVLSSPFQRAIETVEGFAKTLNMKVTIVEDFRERRVDSCWIEDFMGFAQKQWEDFEYKLSDGECLKEVQTRNIAALEKVLIEHKNKNIVVASHGTALSTILNYYDNSFGFKDFNDIKYLMPWIVKFIFDENRRCIVLEKINVFDLE